MTVIVMQFWCLLRRSISGRSHAHDTPSPQELRQPYWAPLQRDVWDIPILIVTYVGGCQNYGPLLGPYYNTAPIIWVPKKEP